MALVILFLLGIANFALHKAVLESGHPLLRASGSLFRLMGGRFSLWLEFALLLFSMVLTDQGTVSWAWGYAGYSAANAISAWLILTRRI